MISPAGTHCHLGASVLVECARMLFKKRVFSGRGGPGILGKCHASPRLWLPPVGFLPGPFPDYLVSPRNSAEETEAQGVKWNLNLGSLAPGPCSPPASPVPLLLLLASVLVM